MGRSGTQEVSPRGKRVHAVGAYGFGNFGDELFVATVRENESRIWPGATVRTFAPASGAAWYSGSNLLGRIARLGTAMAGLAWATIVAMCGGSILQDVQGVSRLRSKFLGRKRVEALGVSVGPFADAAASLRVANYLGRMDRIVVRDEASVQRLRKLSIVARNGGDLAALSALVGPYERKAALITICPSAASGVDATQLLSQVREGLTAVRAEEGWERPQIALLALSSGGSYPDRPLCEALASPLRGDGLEVETQTFEELGLRGTCKALAQSGMVWSQRLHGGIVAYLSEVPFVLVGHHAKCIDFGRDIGAESLIVDPAGSWVPAIRRLTRGEAPPSIPAEVYRQRARSVYLVGHETRPQL